MTNALTCNLRVTAGAPDAARVAVRNEQFVVGRPLEFDPASRRIAALEYAVGALAAEVINGLREFAWRRRLDLEHVEALVTADLEHGLAYLEVVGEDGAPRVAGVHIKVFVESADETAVRALWTDVIGRLPLLGTFRSAMPVNLELIITV